MPSPSLGIDALTDPRFDVPAVEPARPGTVGWLRTQVARFSRGDDHARRRATVLALLAPIDPDALRRNAFTQARERLRGGPVDLMEQVARPVPVGVLAAALGATDIAVADVLAVAAVYLPPAMPDPAADAALARLVRAFGGPADELAANRIGLLAQTCAATAALIDAAARRVLGGESATPTDDLIAVTLRMAPPATATRRAAVVPVRLTGSELSAGEVVQVDLIGAPFGAGAHACPGQLVALALAAGVLDAVRLDVAT